MRIKITNDFVFLWSISHNPVILDRLLCFIKVYVNVIRKSQ